MPVVIIIYSFFKDGDDIHTNKLKKFFRDDESDTQPEGFLMIYAKF